MTRARVVSHTHTHALLHAYSRACYAVTKEFHLYRQDSLGRSCLDGKLEKVAMTRDRVARIGRNARINGTRVEQGQVHTAISIDASSTRVRVFLERGLEIVSWNNCS